MKFSQLNRLRYKTIILCALFTLLICKSADCYASYPLNNGDKSRYNFKIELPSSYVSGVLIMLNENSLIKASLVNEFGVSAIDYIYYQRRDKIKIKSLMNKIDKWYVKLFLKKDLKRVMYSMKEGKEEYYNKKRNIKYLFNEL